MPGGRMASQHDPPLIAAIRSHLLERMHLRGGGWSH